ncbi:MAG: UbiA family prenyltransferase [Promethearchaeota archaeon]
MKFSRIGLLRLDYLFAVIVPALLALYLNDIPIRNSLTLLGSFGFFGVGGNILNDIIDRKDENDHEAQNRTEGYRAKELWSILGVSTSLGISLLIRPILDHPIIIVFVFIAILLVTIYCLKKEIPIINQVLLAVSHIAMPYFVIKAHSGKIPPLFTLGDGFFLLGVTFMAISGQTVHENIDGDAIAKFSLRTQQLVIVISAFLSIIFGILSLIFLQDLLLIGLILIPIGTIYSFRYPRKLRKSIKDAGILMGNLVMVFLVILLLS